MTSYVITNSQTLRSLAGRTGGDTFTINGGTLTIDQDARYGLGGAPTYSIASVSMSAVLLSAINIDARYVRMIPFNTGSGTITAGATITCGGATGTVIGIYSAINVAPVLTGVATGWIKVTEWNSVAFPTSGTFVQAGFTFTITGADSVGFIEVPADDGGLWTTTWAGPTTIQGEYFEVGTTSGSSATTYQLPTNGNNQYYAAAYVETDTPGVFEPYPCAGTLITAGSIATDAIRGKVCWITTAGVLTFGSDGTNTVGHVPTAGRRVVVPNILLACCTAAARATNVVPNTSLTTRYRFRTDFGAGRVIIRKANVNWGCNFSSPYELDLSDVAVNERIEMSAVGSASTMERCAVGQSAAQSQESLAITNCTAGVTVSASAFTRAAASAGQRVVSITGSTGVELDDVTAEFLTRGTSQVGVYVISSTSVDLIDCAVASAVVVQAAQDVLVQDLITFDRPSGNTQASDPLFGVTIINALRVRIDNYSFGGLTGTAPYGGMISQGSACFDVTISSIGTYTSPLDLQSISGLFFQYGNNAGGGRLKMQRVHAIGARSSTYSIAASAFATDITFENCRWPDAFAPRAEQRNSVFKSVRCNFNAQGTGATYGAHFISNFTADVDGRLLVSMTAPTEATDPYVTIESGAFFTNAGLVSLPTIGARVTWEFPFSVLGMTAFKNLSPTVTGGGAALELEYQLDSGGGFGAWTVASAANLFAETISATGFSIRLRLTALSANSLFVESIAVFMATTLVDQQTTFPLDVHTLTLSGLVVGSDIVILDAGTTTIRTQVDANGGTTYAYEYEGTPEVDIGVLLAGYKPLYLRDLQLTDADTTVLVQQEVSRDYA